MLEHGKVHTEGGKLMIYVQHDEPADPKQRQNWLPPPAGPFRVTMRIYQLREAVLDGTWQPPAVKRVE